MRFTLSTLALIIFSASWTPAGAVTRRECGIFLTSLPSEWTGWTKEPNDKTGDYQHPDHPLKKDKLYQSFQTVSKCLEQMFDELNTVEKALDKKYSKGWPETVNKEDWNLLIKSLKSEQKHGADIATLARIENLELSGSEEVRSLLKVQKDEKPAKIDPKTTDAKKSENPNEPKTEGSDPYSIGNLDAYFIEAHIRYKNLKVWQKKLRRELVDAASKGQLVNADNLNPVEASRSDESRGVLREKVHELMDGRGLRQPFSAVLDSGVVFASAGSDVNDATGDFAAFKRTDQFKTVPFGVVRWGSKHFYEHGGKPHFSFGGRLGLMPTLSPVTVDPPATTTTPAGATDATPTDSNPGAPNQTNPAAQLTPSLRVAQTSTDPVTEAIRRSVFQEAFVWDAGPDLNWQMGAASEFVLSYRFGQTIMATEQPKVTNDEGKEVLAKVVENGAGRAAGYHEMSIGWKYFTQDLSVLHDDHGIVKPGFEATTGVRYNRRFRPAGDHLGLLSDGNPERRFFARFRVDLPTVFKHPKKGESQSPIAFAFAIDWEKGFGGRPSRMPAGTRLMFFGDFDLFKTLKPAKKK
jgi:hypothetical protein